MVALFKYIFSICWLSYIFFVQLYFGRGLKPSTEAAMQRRLKSPYTIARKLDHLQRLRDYLAHSFERCSEIFPATRDWCFFAQRLMALAVRRHKGHARMAAQSSRNSAARTVLNWQSLRCKERYERKMRLLWFLYQLYHKAEASYANSH
jgi:hypothetical protein